MSEQQRVLWREDREKFLAALKDLGPRHVERDRALMMVAYDTGCRVSELAALDVGDYDASHKSLMVINSKAKGHPRREVPIHYRTIRALKAYLRVRKKGEQEAMFLSQKGNRMSVRQIQRVYDHVCELAGINGMGIHTLRHTSATRLLDDRVIPVHQLSRRLGHRTIATTNKYYVHGSVEEEANAIRDNPL